MFLVTYYNANMSFPIFSENPLHPLQKINPPHNRTPQNQNFHTTTDFLLKFFSPHFGKWSACLDITKSAGSQTNKKSLDNDSMTAEIYKNFYQQTYLPNNFRLRILGNKKVLEKLSGDMLVPGLPCRNKFSLIAVKKYTEADFKVSLSCPVLLDFFTYFQIFCPGL